MDFRCVHFFRGTSNFPADERVLEQMSQKKSDEVKCKLYPETQAGGFTSIDGTIEFYNRVNALLDPSMTVLDFGAGRGAWVQDDTIPYRRNLRMLKGKVRQVVGVDIDKAMKTNLSLDQMVLIQIDNSLPFADRSFDMIISDWVFEHIQNSQHVANELNRVLKPGGWICARTPHRFGYIGIGTMLIPDRLQNHVLKKLQPEKKEIDAFPTVHRMNTVSKIRDLFPEHEFKNYAYLHEPEPAYFGNSGLLFRIMMLISHFTPRRFRTRLYIFITKISSK